MDAVEIVTVIKQPVTMIAVIAEAVLRPAAETVFFRAAAETVLRRRATEAMFFRRAAKTMLLRGMRGFGPGAAKAPGWVIASDVSRRRAAECPGRAAGR